MLTPPHTTPHHQVKSRPALNGTHATVLAEQSERWVVQIIDGSSLALKSANLAAVVKKQTKAEKVRCSLL
jgi:hypothetical protein